MDNERTRQKLEFDEEELRMEDPYRCFQTSSGRCRGARMSEEETKFTEQVFDKAKGDAR